MSGVSWQWGRAAGEDTAHAFTRIGAIEGVALHESMCGEVPPRPWALREAETAIETCAECERVVGVQRGAPGGRTWEEIRDGMIPTRTEHATRFAAMGAPEVAPAWAVEILTEVRALSDRVGRVERLLGTGTVRRPRTAATDEVDEAVYEAVRQGARSLREIIDASGRRRQRVCEARDRLIAAGRIREVAGESAGRGPVPRWYEPTDAGSVAA